MNDTQKPFVEQVHDLQSRIANRLAELGFENPESSGNIIHHLAEVACMGRELTTRTLPQFLSSDAKDRDAIGEAVVSIVHDLGEMKEAISDMEPALVELMNFTTT